MDSFVQQLQQWAASQKIEFVCARQSALSQQFISPYLLEWEQLLLQYRDQLDALYLQEPQPRPHRKHYPKGYCLEITTSGFEWLQQQLAAPQHECVQQLAYFIQQGGVFKRIWGDLRGRYFQNAMQFGCFYIDIANDTVDIRKPRVEILPLADAGMHMIEDIQHFVRIAGSYWTGAIYPNTVLPLLAPVLPVLHIADDGLIRLQPNNRMLFAQNLLHDCQPAYTYFQHASEVIPEALAQQWLEKIARLDHHPLLALQCTVPQPSYIEQVFKLAAQTNGPYRSVQGVQDVIQQMNLIHGCNADDA